MIWAGAVMIWAGACPNTNFPTLKMPKNAKKAKCDGPTDRPIDRQTDRPTDRPTDTVAYRSRARDKKMKTGVVYIGILASVFILIIYSFAYRSKAIE